MNYSDFKTLPLNTQRAYTMCMDKSGCEIYIPVIVRDDKVIAEAKKGLLAFLIGQPEPDLTTA